MNPLASRALSGPARPGREAANISATTSRCPKTLDALLDWLRETWDGEPFPDRIHSRGQDGRLGLRFNGAFLQHAQAPMATNEEGYFLTPLNAALAYLSEHGKPLAARNIWAVIRIDFNWRAVAQYGGWAEEMYALYLTKAIETLYWVYKATPYRAA